MSLTTIKLAKQRSSRGTSRAGQAILAQNLTRETVLVLKSGVQLERLTTASVTKEVQEAHSKSLRKRSRAAALEWTVTVTSVFDNDGQAGSSKIKSRQERWKLKSVPRGIRDALSTGLFLPGSSWRLWIPAEHAAGFAEDDAADTGIVILSVRVISVNESPKTSASIAVGLLNSLVHVVLSFLLTKLTGRPRNQLALLRGSQAMNVALPLSYHPTKRTLRLGFVVDGEDVGDCDFELYGDGNCAKWFEGSAQSLEGKESVSTQGGEILELVGTVTSLITSPEEDLLEDTIVRRFIASNPDLARAQMRILIRPSTGTCYIVVGKTKSIENECVCVGVVRHGEEAVFAALNCDDGAIVTDVSMI